MTVNVILKVILGLISSFFILCEGLTFFPIMVLKSLKLHLHKPAETLILE